MWRIAILILFFLLALQPACRKAPRDHRAEVIEMVNELETLVEKRALSDIKERIDPNYRDARGQSKGAVVRYIQVHFLRRGTIGLVSHIRSVDLASPPREAKVNLIVGAGSTPISDFKALSGLNADLFEVDLQVREEDGEWFLQSADWKRIRFNQLESFLDRVME